MTWKRLQQVKTKGSNYDSDKCALPVRTKII